MLRSVSRRAFTMIEVFGVLMLITLLILLLLPAVQSAREMARRTSCANNMMQVSIGMQSYHSAFRQLPLQLSGTDGSTVLGADNDRRLSVFVGILPFMDQRELAAQLEKPLARPLGEIATMDDGSFGFEMFESSMGFSGGEETTPEPETYWPVGGPEPFVVGYRPWETEAPVYRCPSDPGIGRPAVARTNYAICLGDAVLASDSGPMKEVAGVFVVDPELEKQTAAAMRGLFVPRVATRFSDAADGLAYTLMLGEIATGLSDRSIFTQPVFCDDGGEELRDNPGWARTRGWIDQERSSFWNQHPTGRLATAPGMRRGYRWFDGMPLYSAFNTILPPNRELILAQDRDDCWGVLPPSSRHQGGAQVALADGSIRFVSDSIDSGQQNQATVYDGSVNSPGSPSPFGVWGALGTRASDELSPHKGVLN